MNCFFKFDFILFIYLLFSESVMNLICHAVYNLTFKYSWNILTSLSIRHKCICTTKLSTSDLWPWPCKCHGNQQKRNLCYINGYTVIMISFGEKLMEHVEKISFTSNPTHQFNTLSRESNIGCIAIKHTCHHLLLGTQNLMTAWVSDILFISGAWLLPFQQPLRQPSDAGKTQRHAVDTQISR